VAQISTEHPPGEGAPSVTFLGTHFDNLKIAGHKVEVDLNLNFCGGRPQGPWIEGSPLKAYISPNSFFMNAVAKLYDDLHESLKSMLDDEDKKMEGRRDLPELFRTNYHKDLLAPAKLEEQGDKARVQCSLVKSVKMEGVGKSFGHVIHVPDFGKISLADLTVNHNTFSLTMINLQLGCLGDGTIAVGTNAVNGGGGKGGGGTR
jgi:hypothetical protein